MDNEEIGRLIHLIRGQHVILDEDLARLYGVATKKLNQQVKRNPTCFPTDFMFRLTAEESSNLKSQIVTSSWGGRRKWPLAFTREGIGMLSSVLRSPRGNEVNVSIMRAFVRMYDTLSARGGLAGRVERAEETLKAIEAEQGEHAVSIHELFAKFRDLEG